jgi:hypothetical protein
MFLVNCAVEENSPTLDTSANVIVLVKKKCWKNGLLKYKKILLYEMAYEKDDSNPRAKNWDLGLIPH